MTTALTAGVRRVTARLTPDDTPDGELLARFLAHRDEAAFAVLVRRHGAMVFGTCRRVLGNAADADDAFQAAFVVLVRRASAFTGRATVGNFLYGVAYHAALKAKAMAAKRRLREAKAGPPPAAADDSELLAALDAELARLPEKYREPVVLCELEGKARREVAAHLGVAEGTISSRLTTAHRMLHKRLTARGFAVVGVAALLADRPAGASPALAAAAVHAALTGPTGGASQLVAEVLKMMFLSKLKLGAAVVAGVAVLLVAGAGLRPGDATAEDKPAAKAEALAAKKEKTPFEKKVEAEQDEAKKLYGTWVVKQTTQENNDGMVLGITASPTLSSQEWTFSPTEVKVVVSEGKTVVHSIAYRYVINPHAKPKELNLIGDKTLLLCLYELDGNRLKVAWYGGEGASYPAAANDGEKTKNPGYSRSEVDRPRSFDWKDKPKGADALGVLEFERTSTAPKATPKAALPKDVQDLYSLADGEVLKLIPGPFPDGRRKMLASLLPQEPGFPFGWYVLTTDGKKLALWRGASSGVIPNAQGVATLNFSVALDHLVRTALRLEEQELYGLDVLDGDGTEAAEHRVYTDVLVREGTPMEKLVPALQKELKSKFKFDLEFSYSHQEREVFRLTGKHKMTDKPSGHTIDLYASSKLDKASVVVGSSASAPFLANSLARMLNRPVIDESDTKTNSVRANVHFHKRLPSTPETLAEDCDPEKVLKNFADQTGLTVDKVTRKVRVLTVTKAEKK